MSTHLTAICVLDLNFALVIFPFISRWQCTAMHLIKWYYLYGLELEMGIVKVLMTLLLLPILLINSVL